MATVNNLKSLHSRMRSNDNPHFYTPKRKRLSEREEEFGSLQAAASYVRGKKLTLSQEKAGTAPKDSSVAHAELAIIGQAQMDSVERCSMGTEFEDAFFDKYTEGIYLRNRIPIGSREVMSSALYKLARVKRVQRGALEPLPPLVDFIAYNKKHWFALECKSHIREKDETRSNLVYFRNWQQITELEEPTSRTQAGIAAVQRICASGVRLPSMIVKRDMISGPKNGPYTFELVFMSVVKP